MAFKMNTPSMINISYKNQSSGISPLHTNGSKVIDQGTSKERLRTQIKPGDKGYRVDPVTNKQSLLNQFRKFRTKVGNKVRKALGEPNFNDEPQSIKKEHSDLFSRNVH